jgi:amidase
MKQWGLFLEQYPLVITPVGAVPGAAADQDTQEGGMTFMLDNFARFLFPAPVLGLPVLAMPVGSHNGMPQGVQIYAAKYREDLCLEAGEIIETWEGPRAPVDPKF